MNRHAIPVVRSFTGGGFGENCYLVSCPNTNKGLLIDPGAAVGSMLDSMRSSQIDVKAIVLTHAHLDHIEGVAEARRAVDVPIHLHPDDEFLYKQAPLQAQLYGVRVEIPPPVDEYLAQGEIFSFGDCSLEVRHTPGHAPGHVILKGAEVTIVGDCVFAGSIGRTDLPGGDFQTLMHSIRTEILTLPDEVVLYSGHGPKTTVGHERISNPFLVPQFGGSRFV